ncbi:NAD(P)/FAD-dependent oxidoreductase [Conyzicola nivalis]|uniref:FAD-dependent pyridine nucleotide-disulphide oxidoreductase n=1 Tax=Conyzicola nivalis TaxID=1477021 RepID=A0A916WLF1_9MICO|nr:putative FAD-dependent pyridine nucleotide-disulphide oxidoreductase [Conyzicola nivalis]
MVIIGGGPAGLSGAVALGRARRSVVVVDSGEPRNAPAHAVHNFLTRDGTSPAELRRLGREEARAYGAELVDARADGVQRTDDGFAVRLSTGSVVTGRRLLVTTGLVDELPEVEGLRERWGVDALHCPYCHGWEVRDRAIGVLASGPRAFHQALLFRQWSPDITLLLNGQALPEAEQLELLAARGIKVVEGRVERLVVEDDTLVGVELAGGSVHALEALVVGAPVSVRAGLLVDLGLELAEHPMGMGLYVATDASGATSLPGVWAAGNVTNLAGQVITSAGEGLWAGAQINASLIADDERDALEAYRAAR